MNIKQHQIWKTRCGLLAWVTKVCEYDLHTYPIEGVIYDESIDEASTEGWTRDGYYIQSCEINRYDLVELVKE